MNKLYVYIYLLFFGFPSHLGYHRALNRAPYAVDSHSQSLCHGILQAGVLEWVAISFSWGSSHPRDRSQVSHIPVRCFTFPHMGSPCCLCFQSLHTPDSLLTTFPSSIPLSTRHLSCLCSKFFLKPFFSNKACPYSLFVPQTQT